MLILVGPSASGKTEVGKILEDKYQIKKLITYTTREKRAGEIDGVDYHFITRDQFIANMNANFFFETVIYSNNYYGTAEEDIKDNAYVILDPLGLTTYKNSHHFTVSFYFNVSEELRISRMKQRKDSEIDIERRIAFDRQRFTPNTLKYADNILHITSESVTQIAEYINTKYQQFLLAKN